MLSNSLPYRYGHSYFEELKLNEKNFVRGLWKIQSHPIFSRLEGDIVDKKDYGGKNLAKIRSDGRIFVNTEACLGEEQWEYVIAHCLLHFAFGHFDKDKMPEIGTGFSTELWNQACDIYIARYLADIQLGKPIQGDPAEKFPIKLNDEKKIYDYLQKHPECCTQNLYGTANIHDLDMIGLDRPLEYKAGESNQAEAAFVYAMELAAAEALGKKRDERWESEKETGIERAAQWFINNYPLLGGLAASFKIVQEQELCWKHEIHIAAVDSGKGIIYANPAAGLTDEEWKFVLAHEYLHAALQHGKRTQGRNMYLWNVATDYVINGWLTDMHIGSMPEQCFYKEEYSNKSAEEIYDDLLQNIRKNMKIQTFRGHNRGDIISESIGDFSLDGYEGIDLDEFYRSSLSQGLDYHNYHGRGYLPVGLIQEIKALAEPAIPWEVDLAIWFDEQFPPVEKRRTYARPSRRQASTPDIVRPRYVYPDTERTGRTFAVIIDTSGSMGIRLIAKALGAAASYAIARDVGLVRVIFCDADAYDAGYMAAEEIADKVEIQGGGGTVLQPAVNLLEEANDFPQNGPILVITDGYIEEELKISRKHAFLIPKGHKLPFKAKGKVFYLA